MKLYAAIVLGGLTLGPALAWAQTPPVPPTPAPTIPPPPATPGTPAAVAVPVPPPAAAEPAPAAPADEKKDEEPKSPFEIVLGNESHNAAPCTHGAAKAEEGKIEVTAKDNSLKAVLAGGVGANVFLGATSTAEEFMCVTQEFEIKSSDPNIQEVVLAVDSSLVGFVRIKQKASACVRAANVTISPAGWPNAPIYICHPLPCVAGPTGHCTGPVGYMNKDPLPTFTSPPLPLGQYVLQANFILDASAGGILDGHSTAIYTSDPKELDPWEREHDLFKGEKKDDFGFTTIVTANPVGTTPQTSAWKVWKKRSKLAKRNARQNNGQPLLLGEVPPPPIH